MLEIEQWKLLSNSNGHNFSLGGPIHAHNILRRPKLNYGSSREIQIVITLHMEVRFKHIRYGDARNLAMEALSKLNNGSCREIQMLITFSSEVRFRRIIYRDARNWTTEALEKFRWSKLFTRRSDSGASHIETLAIEQRKLSRYSIGHKF